MVVGRLLSYWEGNFFSGYPTTSNATRISLQQRRDDAQQRLRQLPTGDMLVVALDTEGSVPKILPHNIRWHIIWSNYFTTSHDLGPQKVAEEGKPSGEIL